MMSIFGDRCIQAPEDCETGSQKPIPRLLIMRSSRQKHDEPIGTKTFLALAVFREANRSSFSSKVYEGLSKVDLVKVGS